MTNLQINDHTPRVSIVIPSWDGYRDGCVPRLVDSIEAQSFRDFDVHIIKHVSPQGRAINQGVAQSRGPILVIVDDDSRLADPSVLQRLLDTLDSDSRIGMAGASIVLAPEATSFQQRAARQFPRLQTPVVDTVIDSDLACHGCCAIPRAVFEKVGGEREDILRGLDPDLRVRLRAAGYRVVLSPQTRIHHPLPGSVKKLVRTFFRNGYGSAYAQKFEPASVYETHERLDSSTFQPRTPFVYRVIRFPMRLVRALIMGQELRLVAYSSYAAGYVWGLVSARRLSRSPMTARQQ